MKRDAAVMTEEESLSDDASITDDLFEASLPPRPPSRRRSSLITFSTKNFVPKHVGELADRYEKGHHLGSGAYGSVYECVHKETGAERAVKVIEKKKTCRELNEQVMKEFNVLKRLDHPNILKMYEFFEDTYHYYIVTDICRGGELFQELQEWGNFCEEDAVEVISQLLAAINYINGVGIVHCDLKPENILLEGSKKMDQVKIIDFGVSQIYECSSKPLVERVGTSYYVAPEVIEGSYGPKCDVWSCGVIAYVLLAGFPPFDGYSDEEVFEQVQRSDFDFDDPIWDMVSDEAKDFISMLLTKDPNNRPTAEQALKHPWVDQHRLEASMIFGYRESANERAINCLCNLQQFHAQTKLKQACCAFISSQLLLKEEKEKIDELFRALDIHGQGKLSKLDVQNGYKEMFHKDLTDDDVDDMFRRVDYDGMGHIGYSEFVVAAMNEKDLLNNDRLRQAFNMFDKDGSGTISTEDLIEVLTFFQSTDNTLNSRAIKSIIQQVDDNGDGVVSFEEFADMMFESAEQRLGAPTPVVSTSTVRKNPVATVASPPKGRLYGTLLLGVEGLMDHSYKSIKSEPGFDHSTVSILSYSSVPETFRRISEVHTRASLALFVHNIQKCQDRQSVPTIRIARHSKKVAPLARLTFMLKQPVEPGPVPANVG